jgi:hypothetical protein
MTYSYSQGELASKADLLAVKAELREEISKIDGKMKLYFVITIAIILLTNSKAMDIVAKLLGLVK